MSQIINVGTIPNDGTGDKLRNAFIIVNDNFASIDTLLSGNDVLTISQITGLQTALNNINNQLSYIPGLQSDINSINNTIYTINQTLNLQNSSIADLYDEITNLQNQIYTKIEEAPIDGNQYARKDGGWVIVTGGGAGTTPSLQEVIAVNPVTGLSFQVSDGAGSYVEVGTNILAVNNPGLNNYSFIQDGFVTMNFTSNKRIDITADGIRFKNGPDNGLASIVPNLSQVAGVTPTYQLPAKIGSSLYTLATTDMISSTPSLQQVTNVGAGTTNNIQINTGISGTGSKILNLTSGYISLFSQNQGAMQIEWNRILFPSSNNIASSVSFGSTGNAGTQFWLPGFKSNYSTPHILAVQEDVWVPFTGSSNNINIVKASSGPTFSTATFYVRGLTSSNNSLIIASTGSNNNSNWGWNVSLNPDINYNYLQANTASTATGAVGRFVWNDTDGTLDLGLKGGNVTLQLGQEQVVRVVNKTTTNITLLESNYQAVRVTGAQGQRLKVDLAIATSDLTSAETIGLVTETILNNQEGFVTTSGLVRNLNTTGSLQGETWADGDLLYLSPLVEGQITNVKPVAPDHLIIIGYVVHSHITQGTIFVKVDNGYELNELHNVKINGVTGSQVLTYNGTSSLWENKTLPTIASQIGYTPLRLLNVNTTAHTGTLSETIITTGTILGGSFNTYDVMKVFMQTNKLLSTANVSYRIKINTTNSLSGAVQVGTFTSTTTLSYTQIQRTFTLRDNLLYGYTFAGSSVNDFANTGGSLSSTAYNTTNTLYVFFTIQLGNIGDSATISLTNITN